MAEAAKAKVRKAARRAQSDFEQASEKLEQRTESPTQAALSLFPQPSPGCWLHSSRSATKASWSSQLQRPQWRERNFYRNLWHPAQQGSGLDIRPHECPHSYVTHLRAAGVNDADLAEIAGHRVETMLALYARHR